MIKSEKQIITLGVCDNTVLLNGYETGVALYEQHKNEFDIDSEMHYIIHTPIHVRAITISVAQGFFAEVKKDEAMLDFFKTRVTFDGGCDVKMVWQLVLHD